MRFSPGDDGSWRAALAGALPGSGDGRPSFTLYSAVAEASAWAARAPLSAWERGANAQSMRADVEAGLAVCGTASLGLFQPVGTALVESLNRLVHGSKDHRASDVSALGEVAREAEAMLQSPSLRVAAWRDLTDAAGADRPDLAVIEDRIALLHAMLACAAVDPGERFGRLANVLSPSPAALAYDPGAASVDWTDGERLKAGAALLREPASTGHCVVWMTFAAARLPEFVLEMGPVTLFDADWCIGNALGPPWQDFAYRDELTHVIAHDHERASLDPNVGTHHEVLARVDLGHHSTYDSQDEAAALVRAVVGVVANRTGAPSWRRCGFSCLVVDEKICTYSFGRPGDEPLFTEPDHYGMNGFMDALADYKAQLVGLLSTGALPTDVTEALRLVREAGQVDSRENALNGTTTIAEQTVVVLQAAAVERLAAYAGMNGKGFASELAAEWAVARHHQEVGRAVEWCLSGVGGGRNPLFHRVVTFPSGRRRLNLVAAFEVREQLVVACSGPFERERTHTLLASIGDADAARGLLSSFAAEAAVLHDRLKRCRNGLMHGNPVSVESVSSVRALSRFMVDVALNDAIRSIAEDRPVNELVEDRARRRQATMAAIEEGTSFYQLWNAASGSV